MRTSASSIKGRTSGCLIQSKPKEGTKLRRVYDRAMQGDWFIMTDIMAGHSTSTHNTLQNLRIMYELEIIFRRRGRKCNEYKCIGIWVGADLKGIEEAEVAIEYTQSGGK